MDRVEKIDSGANGEVIVRTKRPPLSQSPKTCDLSVREERCKKQERKYVIQ